MGSIPIKVDDHIKKSIDHTLGLQVPSNSLQMKIRCLEASNYRIRDQYLNLQLKFKEKDEAVEFARAESCMNAQALKKFVEENQKLTNERASLISQCSRLERECKLYDRDREVLLEFGNEADERAKVAENKVQQLEEQLRRVYEEVVFYRKECGARSGESSVQGVSLQQNLLEEVVASLVNEDETTKTAHAFLEYNTGAEPCQMLLKMWGGLTPATQNVLSLAAQVRKLQKDKEHLRINLHRAEEEVKLLYDENLVLDEENKSLWTERKHLASGGKNSSSAGTKSNKRKSSPLSDSAETKIELGDMDSPRRPLSPWKENSPESRMNKKQETAKK